MFDTNFKNVIMKLINKFIVDHNLWLIYRIYILFIVKKFEDVSVVGESWCKDLKYWKDEYTNMVTKDFYTKKQRVLNKPILKTCKDRVSNFGFLMSWIVDLMHREHRFTVTCKRLEGNTSTHFSVQTTIFCLILSFYMMM